jgi:nucleotide-binding universal stress UspA family protein
MNLFLVALDGSPRAEGVLRDADTLAAKMGARLWLVHCVPLPPELPVSLWTAPDTTFVEQLRVGARKEIEALARSIPPERLAGITIDVGTPWRTICEAADEHGADLVVIGAHGYGTLERVLGTTAARVVNHSKHTVLVVRAPDSQKGEKKP